MERLKAEAEAFSQQPGMMLGSQKPKTPSNAPEEDAAHRDPQTPKAEAKRAQSNPRSLFRRRNAKQPEETKEEAKEEAKEEVVKEEAMDETA